MRADARLLSNGRYATLVTGTGTGASTWDGLALTAWRDDPVEDGDGLFVYLRDVETGRFWSVGHRPVERPATQYATRYDAGRVEIERVDDDLETALAIAVDPDADLGIRRLRLMNRGSRPRRIEVTSWVEVVLNDSAAHAGHPAFSKLFVQTEYVAEKGLLLAHRRPRSREERVAWLVHALAGDGALEHETDRARFLGRHRSLAAPRALTSTAALSGTVGSVLDPVLCLRRTVEVPAGGTAELALLLGAAATRDAALGLAARAASPAAAEAILARARAGAEPNALLSGDPPVATPRFRPLAPGATPAEPSAEPLRFDNGHGGFAADGLEYVIRLGPDRDPPPMPWINVVANERFGFLVSESGAGCTWSRNSHEHRLTPWYNDPIADPHGEALYVRDEEAGVFWSPLPGPVGPTAPCRVAHGFGYSRWSQTNEELAQEVVLFVPAADPVKIARLRVTNRSARPRRLSLFAYWRLVLGVLPGAPLSTELDAGSGTLFAENPNAGDFAGAVVFAAAVPPAGAGAVRHTADRATFLGRGGTPACPAALGSEALDGRVGAGLDPCAALQVPVSVAPGETVECAFLLGETADRDAARAMVARYRAPGAVERALDEVRARWRELQAAVRVETPVPGLDLMMNGWLGYQILACRLWGRSAFYQSGGAFGFRDQLQDAAALVHARPDLTRAQIVLHAAHQFVEGDVLHWWHPPADRGTRTHFSDDLVWLPYVTAFYVGATGDFSVLDEQAPFLTARALAPGEDEAYLLPSKSGETADVYAHCCRALDRAMTRGSHGLPLMGTGDWNDGMNRVGREGRGESVWLAFFLCHVLGLFLPLCERRGDAERARRYADYRAALVFALERNGWDGEWYRRAYYDDGTPLGSAASDECRIDALAQAWAVISGAAPRARAERAMDAVERLLVDEEAGLIRLLTPPFDRTPHDPGYIKGYVPGIRENGGQYTHAALWVVRALAELGRRDRAARLLEMLGPVERAVSRYQVEPYVVVADVYGTPPHIGRGGWTWYTGSAGWMYRVALESVLGVTVEAGETLRVRPRIPDQWPRFAVALRLFGGRTRYDVEVENPRRRAEAVTAVEVDGRAGVVEGGGARVPLLRDGELHRVRVTLGPA